MFHWGMVSIGVPVVLLLFACLSASALDFAQQLIGGWSKSMCLKQEALSKSTCNTLQFVVMTVIDMSSVSL